MIEAKNVYKSFNGRQVFEGLSLTIHKGETLVIIGRSGCGKSVFLKHCIGILEPDKGEIIVDGLNVAGLSAAQMMKLRMRFGMVFQGSALFDSMTVGENVGFALIEHSKLAQKMIGKKVEEALELVGLKGIQDLKPAELSGGMKKRVALARAICVKPEIVLYDEPTTGLDPIMADAINNLIKELHDKLKITSVVVTHDMVSAYKVGSRIAMMHKGKIIELGGPEDIKHSGNPVVMQFIRGSAKGPMTESNSKGHKGQEGKNT